MAKQKNPYINNMKLEDIAHVEANHWYIQVGEETVEFNGRHTFTKERAEYLFYELLASMIDMSKNGNAQDRKIAKTGMCNFRMHALRIH